ncbi:MULTISPECIES: hypothetical protein [Bacillus cereus group]|uniref:hypothetical protein n=1 Tax=Bacillus cereus group TaxID=86661 RepID=UPI0022E529B8|nr:hypothetical protein [Bacillus cereus group sp. TH152-1LC]MDA1674724.1 hypothetical protein [Bacillus cereus group sp. TH152-1LC]
MVNENLEKEKVYGVIGKELTLDDFQIYQRKGFITTQSNLLKYNDKSFQIVRSLTSDEVDLISAPMFKVQFEDGFQTEAFMDEIFERKIFDELIKDENLFRD